MYNPHTQIIWQNHNIDIDEWRTTLQVTREQFGLGPTADEGELYKDLTALLRQEKKDLEYDLQSLCYYRLVAITETVEYRHKQKDYDIIPDGKVSKCFQTDPGEEIEYEWYIDENKDLRRKQWTKDGYTSYLYRAINEVYFDLVMESLTQYTQGDDIALEWVLAHTSPIGADVAAAIRLNIENLS